MLDTGVNRHGVLRSTILEASEDQSARSFVLPSSPTTLGFVCHKIDTCIVESADMLFSMEILACNVTKRLSNHSK
jgi:hypothetical protein